MYWYMIIEPIPLCICPNKPGTSPKTGSRFCFKGQVTCSKLISNDGHENAIQEKWLKPTSYTNILRIFVETSKGRSRDNNHVVTVHKNANFL